MSTRVDDFDSSVGDVPTIHTEKVHEDYRGNFCEVWNAERCPIPANAKAQINHSCSADQVLRGLHWQVPPHALAKYVTCLQGKIQDVVVDLRRSSETFGKWNDYILEGGLGLESRDSLWVPKGFAHGFLALRCWSEVVYLQVGLWNRGAERILHYDDPEVGIKWATTNVFNEPPQVSDKDAAASTLSELTDADLFD